LKLIQPRHLLLRHQTQAEALAREASVPAWEALLIGRREEYFGLEPNCNSVYGFGIVENSSPKKSAHKVFLSTQVCPFPVDQLANAAITQDAIGRGPRLAWYDLVLLDFSEFGERAQTDGIDQFSTQADEALKSGATICLVHYDEQVPGDFHDGSEGGYHDQKGFAHCLKLHAGFRLLLGERIRVGRRAIPLHGGRARRTELAEFCKKWGASYNFFQPFGGGSLDDILYTVDDLVLGFCRYRAKGMLIYLPYQRKGLNPSEHRLAVETLIDALLTYKSKRHRVFPGWAAAPFFRDEESLQNEKAALETALRQKEGELSVFKNAKWLLVANEGDLELAVPKFVAEKLGIPTLRDETFNEDFWLTEESGKKSAICEVKSVTKGFKKGSIYELYSHRENRELEEAFPALLFVNANLQAASWQSKDVPISPTDQKTACENNVLIVRIEDLVRVWDALRKGALKPEEVRRLFHESKGWAEVTTDLKINIRAGN
jgi:hypothetical protein